MVRAQPPLTDMPDGFRHAAEPEVVLAFLRGEVTSAAGLFEGFPKQVDWLGTAEAVDDLIIMATPDLDELVLLEGHARLTAVFVGGHQERLAIRAYVGLSPAVRQWCCF